MQGSSSNLPETKRDGEQPTGPVPDDAAAQTLLAMSSGTADGTIPPITAAQNTAATEKILLESFGRYQVQKQLGRGGMGSVWAAIDTQLQRTVALKIPSFGRDCPQEIIQRFYREARTAATLSHPNICPIHDVGELNGVPFISMSYIEGRPLSQYFQPGKGLKERTAATIIRKLALALHEAHQNGIIHRDIKPANIIINQRNEPILMDFGLALPMGDDGAARMTQTGVVIGSPQYMSPEQVEGASDLGPATDIYSLGVVMYEMLAGEPPFRGTLLSVLHQVGHSPPTLLLKLRPSVSRELAAICHRALAKRPEERFASMEEFAAALGSFLKGQADTGSVADGRSTKQLSREPELANLAETMPVPAHRGLSSKERPRARSASARKKPATSSSRRLWIAISSIAGAVVLGVIAVAFWPPSEPGASPDVDRRPASMSAGQPQRPESSPPPNAGSNPPPPQSFEAGGWPGGPPRTFDEADRDQDGILQPHEYPLHIILRADADGNHRLTRTEWDNAITTLGDRFFAEPDGPVPGFGPPPGGPPE